MKKITPFLWFNGNAEEAARYYVSIFKNSKILGSSRYGDAGPGPKGSVMTVHISLDGEEFIALNAGPDYQFNPAVSFMVSCTTQKEIDDMWKKLSAGGKEVACGWLTDKFGLSWQITPPRLLELINDPDPKKSARVMKAMMQMVKIDIAAIEAAYKGEGKVKAARGV